MRGLPVKVRAESLLPRAAVEPRELELLESRILLTPELTLGVGAVELGEELR